MSLRICQRRGLQFQSDDEKQEDDAKFGDAQNVFGSADEMHDRPDHHAGGEIAENGAQTQLLENGRCHHRAPQQNQSFLEQTVGVRHGIPTSDGRETGRKGRIGIAWA